MTRYHSITCTTDCDGWPCECWCHDEKGGVDHGENPDDQA